MPDAANPEIVDTVSIANMKTIAEMLAFQTGLGAGNSVAWQNLVNNSAAANQQAIFQQAQLQLAAAAQQQQRLNEIANTSIQAMQTITTAIVGSIGKSLSQLDPSQAMSEQALLTGNKVAEQVASLGAALGEMQGAIKAGQTVPPVSAPPPVSGA